MQNDICKYMYRKWSSHVKTRADLINLSTLTISANTKKSKEKWNCNGIEFFFLVLDLFVYVNGKISFLPKLDYIFFMRLEMLKPNSNKTSTFTKYLNCSSFNQSQDKPGWKESNFRSDTFWIWISLFEICFTNCFTNSLYGFDCVFINHIVTKSYHKVIYKCHSQYESLKRKKNIKQMTKTR